MSPEICPICGAEVPPNAKACPECGSDDETGWSDKAREQEMGLPDEEFNYDEFVKEEFGEKKESNIRPRGINRLWWLVGIGLLAGILVWILYAVLGAV